MSLAALLDVTVPPPLDADVDTLLAAFHAMFSDRQRILDGLTAPIAVTDEERALLTERETAWSRALARALAAVSQHRVNTTKLRGYAPAI